MVGFTNMAHCSQVNPQFAYYTVTGYLKCITNFVVYDGKILFYVVATTYLIFHKVHTKSLKVGLKV